MKYHTRAIQALLTAAAIMVSGARTLQAATDYVEVDHVVAIINDDVIVRSELDQRYDQLVATLEQSGASLPPQHVLERQVLDRLITTRLQLQEAERRGIAVDDETLARSINNIARSNDLTLSELRQVIDSEGMKFSRFREDMRREIITSRLRNQTVRNRIVVSDQEVEQFLSTGPDLQSGRTAFQLAHILIATPEGASPETLDQAAAETGQLVGELRQGADFAELALTHSDGQKALDGGDLGWIPVAQVPTLFVDRIGSMERGDISDPIRSASGFHIVKVVDYKGGDRHIITQTHARHILIRTNEIVSDQDARQRLQQLSLRIQGGEDFSTLARSHSDDKASAIKGGDLGWVSPGSLAPEFEDQMNKLQDGALSGPFRTEFGWHVVQVLERREHDETEEVMKSEAKKNIRQRKMEEEVELWLRRLRDEAYIEYRLEDF